MQHTSPNRWERILQSPNYREGAFRNLSVTSVMSPDTSLFKILRDGLKRPEYTRPSTPLPAVRTDLKALPPGGPVIVWFGHSSYLIHTNGINILVDPVFSGSASPLPFLVRAFPGTEVYRTDDLPAIDALILTHDHYDHYNKKTIEQLKPRTLAFYTPLGVGKYLAACHIQNGRITELDWWEHAQLTNDIELIAMPARHFSGRGLKRGGTLWASYLLKTGPYKIYLGGDSGYDTHFREIGDEWGPFDLAILECGQYNLSWPQIHMMPEETVQAAIDLRASVMMPVHWGKFALAYHSWKEPVERAVKAAAEKQVPITTPMIGEPVIVGGSYPHSKWWEL